METWREEAGERHKKRDQRRGDGGILRWGQHKKCHWHFCFVGLFTDLRHSVAYVLNERCNVTSHDSTQHSCRQKPPVEQQGRMPALIFSLSPLPSHPPPLAFHLHRDQLKKKKLDHQKYRPPHAFGRVILRSRLEQNSHTDTTDCDGEVRAQCGRWTDVPQEHRQIA